MRGYFVDKGEIMESEFEESTEKYGHYHIKRCAKRLHVDTHVSNLTCFVIKDCAVTKAMVQLNHIVRMCKAEREIAKLNQFTFFGYDENSLKEAIDNLQIAREEGPVIHLFSYGS